MMKLFSGMYAAIPTPFGPDGSIQKAPLLTLCEEIVESGMHGILVCGSTGEYSLMSQDERKQAVKLVCDIVAGRSQVIAGCSCHNQNDTIDMVRYAESVGADMALVMHPYYMKTTEDGIFAYYQAISESVSKIGILLYNYPETTTIDLPIELIARVSRLPHVVGIKDTSDMQHTSRLVELVRDNPDFGVINGYEHLLMSSLTSGGSGTMGIIHALAPKQVMEIYHHIENNDLRSAMKVNEALRTLYTLMEKEPCPGPIKAALRLKGIEFGEPRRPLLPASDKIVKELEIEMRKLAII